MAPQARGMSRHAAYASALVAAWLLVGPVAMASPPRRADVFHELQRNAWYLPTADGRARLYVTALGTGPNVIVLHGGPGNDFHYFVGALDGLTDRHRFVLFDQRGSLLSPVPDVDVAGLTLATLVDDLETLRVALGDERVVLLGHSFGTLLALAYYERHPDRVAGLVLTAAVPPFTPENGTFADLLGGSRARIDDLRRRPEVQRAIRNAGAAGQHLTPQQQSVRRRIEQHASFNLVHVDRWREIHGGGVYYDARVDEAVGSSIAETYDVRLSLRRRALPITVIQGDQDYVDPRATSWHTLAATEPLVRVHVLEAAGHYGWVDAPAAFRAHVAASLAAMAPGEQAAVSTRRPRDILNEWASRDGRAEVLVLGTPHLSSLGERWNPRALDTLLDTMADFRPDVIAVERMPPTVIDALESLGGRHREVAEIMVRSSLQFGRMAQGHLGVSRAEAEQHALTRLSGLAATTGDRARHQIRLEAALRLLAAYDEPSAMLQWSYVPADVRHSSNLVPDSIAAHLDRMAASPGEIASIAAAVARRVGLDRLVSMDDHQEAAETLEFWDELSAEIGQSAAYASAKTAPIYAEANRRLDAALATGDLLPHYRWLNSAAFTDADVDAQFGVFLRTRLPSGLDRARLARWEVRNMRMAAHIRQASARRPGGRVLVIVGIAHKPFLDDYLAQAADVNLVQLPDLQPPLAAR